jgi:hypothetical protein
LLPLIGGFFCIDADQPSEEEDHRVDWLGAFLISSGLVLVVFVLSDGETAPQGWKTSYILACLVLGVALLGAFIYWQIYLERVQSQPGSLNSKWTPPPLIKPSLWSRANGRLAIMMVIAFLNWCCFISWTFWVTVIPCFYSLCHTCCSLSSSALLSRLHAVIPYPDRSSVTSNDYCGTDLQPGCHHSHLAGPCCVHYRFGAPLFSTTLTDLVS